MSHTVFGTLRKAPYIKEGLGQDGQSTMFVVELSEVTKDRQTQDKAYTNYSAAIFAKSPAQIDYYRKSLVEGNFIVVTSEKLKVETKEHKGKQYTTLQMEGAKLAGANYIDDNQSQAQGGFQQQAPQQQAQGGFQQQAPQQQQGGFQQQQASQQAPQQQQGFQNQSQFQQAPQAAGQPVNQGFQPMPNDNEPPF